MFKSLSSCAVEETAQFVESMIGVAATPEPTTNDGLGTAPGMSCGRRAPSRGTTPDGAIANPAIYSGYESKHTKSTTMRPALGFRPGGRNKRNHSISAFSPLREAPQERSRPNDPTVRNGYVRQTQQIAARRGHCR